MIVVEGRHDLDLRLQRQERVVVLVGLDDERVRLSGMRVRPESTDRRTANERGVDTACAQSEPGHRGGRGLSVRSGYRDHALALRQKAPRVLALPHGRAAV